jgi:hypothetical protein
VVVATAAAAWESPFAAAAWACDKLMVRLAADAEPGNSAASRTQRQNTKRMASLLQVLSAPTHELAPGTPAQCSIVSSGSTSIKAAGREPLGDTLISDEKSFAEL